VASLFLVMFSIGVAIGSVSINALLKGTVSARYSPWSVIAMGLFIVAFHFVCRAWTPPEDGLLMNVGTFVHHPMAVPLAFAARHRGGGRHVRGAALCVPDHRGRQVRNRAHDRGQQHRQLGRDGGGRGAGGGPQRGQGGADRPVAAGRGDVPGFRLAGQLLYAAERASADEASPA
jgi:hypothetical protein